MGSFIVPRSVRNLSILVIGSVLALAQLGVVHASADPLQLQIDEVLSAHGGVQTAVNEVTWDDGAVVLTLPEATDVDDVVTLAAALTCPAASHCVYSGVGYTGARLVFSSCGLNQSLSAISGVRSAKNTRSNKTIKVYKSSTLLATLAPGGSKASIASGATKLDCS